MNLILIKKKRLKSINRHIHLPSCERIKGFIFKRADSFKPGHGEILPTNTIIIITLNTQYNAAHAACHLL